MNIHEYQAREILTAHGVPVPPGVVATTPEEVERAAQQFGSTVVVKAQVHAGGRGKAGGVKLAKSPAEAKDVAGKILGMRIKDLPVEKVLVAPAEDIASEAYVGMILDRASKRVVVMVSREGGVDIEEVAATNPDAIRKLAVDPRYGLLPYQAYSLAVSLYDDIRQQRACAKILQQLYAAFLSSGASLA
ncbi:MAG: succinate--CoA ligase subunit beta, partial [Candidatus Cloacimonetes bacterium]|nr:succinate--CoA ligase subunit beta [Candidatus Cloacimonadota bacterium]